MNPASADRCDCGYDFVAQSMPRSGLPQDRIKEVPIFAAAGWFIAVAAVVSHFWTGQSTAAYLIPIAVWCALFTLSIFRLEKINVWLLLSSPVVLLALPLWFLLVLAECFSGLSPNGCF